MLFSNKCSCYSRVHHLHPHHRPLLRRPPSRLLVSPLAQLPAKLELPLDLHLALVSPSDPRRALVRLPPAPPRLTLQVDLVLKCPHLTLVLVAPAVPLYHLLHREVLVLLAQPVPALLAPERPVLLVVPVLLRPEHHHPELASRHPRRRVCLVSTLFKYSNSACLVPSKRSKFLNWRTLAPMATPSGV